MASDNSTASPTPQLPPALTLAIENRPIVGLTPLSRKLRIHKKSAITALAGAIRQFGFLVPVLINAEDKIISGYGRVEAARQLGMTDVPCMAATAPTSGPMKASTASAPPRPRLGRCTPRSNLWP